MSSACGSQTNVYVLPGFSFTVNVFVPVLADARGDVHAGAAEAEVVLVGAVTHDEPVGAGLLRLWETR